MEVSCPTCRTKTTWEGNPFRPFCSERCKLLDLSKWLAEEYRIPAAEDEGSRSPDAEEPVQ